MIPCPICSGGESDDFDDLRRCHRCGHIFQFPPRIGVRYDAAYVRTYDRYPTREMSCLRVGYLKAFLAGGRLLDIGYGNGDFLRAAQAAGFDAFGYDVHGVDCGIKEIDFAADETAWDVVTFFDSLEHFADFQPIRRLLDRTLHVMISLPWPPADFPARRQWKHYKPGEHLHYFSAESLQALIRKPKRASSNVEDMIRRGPDGCQNIYTAFFG